MQNETNFDILGLLVDVTEGRIDDTIARMGVLVCCESTVEFSVAEGSIFAIAMVESNIGDVDTAQIVHTR